MDADAIDRQARVLICIPTLRGGGTEHQVRLLVPRLAANGIAISLFSRMTQGDVETMAASGATIFPIRSCGNYNPSLVWELLQACRTSRCTIIHSFLPQMDVLGGMVALVTGRHWVLSERSSQVAYSGSVRDRLRVWLGGFSDSVVANSVGGCDVWPANGRRLVIPNGIDFTAIDRAPATAPDHRLTGRTVVMSVGRLSPEKRPTLLMHAVARLKRSVPEVLLVLVGEGPMEAPLKMLAAELQIADHVLFAGYRADALSWMKAASVLVSASLYEGQPNAVLEAAAIGTPQVLSDIVAHRDAVGMDGAVFADPRNAQALADAILLLLKNNELAREVAAKAQQAVRELSVERAAEQYARLYRNILAAPA